MKLTLIAVTSALVALSFFARAEEMPGMKMEAMAMDGTQMEKPAPLASASGTIKAIDGTKVTIAHGAVPAVQWPPMTMGFKATEAQLAALKVGDQVNFKFQLQGAAATIVSIEATK